ncbi:MAG: precorrin-3B C(17)-methyltransferase [Treponema sp.]|nr:precorrin-3B C(17)-methyltransferase [Treponema sp.]
MKLSVIGIGPGSEQLITGEAREALHSCNVVIGYPLYLDLIERLIEGKERYSTPMRAETERCRLALRKTAEGHHTALVCGGDAGVYGMASLVFELAHEYPPVDIRIIPGITAAVSGAALLGSPLTNDFAVISLSDLLTPPATIETRLRAAAQGDFALCIYNPASKKRRKQLAKACDILLEYRKGDTICGITRNIGRAGERVFLTTLEKLKTYEADMFTTLFIGNSKTTGINGKMVTPRGYPRETPRDFSAPPVPREHSKAREELRLFVFAGAVEGRLFIEHFRNRMRKPFSMWIFTATEYGKTVFEPSSAGHNGDGVIHLCSGRLNAAEMYSEIIRLKPSYVIDCTHPYAAEATRNIKAACDKAGCRRLRLQRKASPVPADSKAVDTAEEAAEFLRGRQGNILLTTGTRCLDPFGAEDLRNRVFPRVLPMEESIRKCRALGIPVKNILCMQGPFSEDFNRALLRETGASWMVTKDSGDEGGFSAKIQAAQKEGAGIILLRRPWDEPSGEPGLTMEEVLSRLLQDSPGGPNGPPGIPDAAGRNP